MRFLLLATIPLALMTMPALAQTKADADAVCEAAFTAMSANARAQGLSTAALDQGADAARRAWTARHAGRDLAVHRTALKVQAASLRQAMHDGRVTLADSMHMLVNCHARYARPQMVASLD
jgi:hypothetical protein